MTLEAPGDHNPARQTIGELVRAGRRVNLRRHVPKDRDIFVAWYQDAVIAELLRHDLAPLTASQARSYFDSIILPATARGTCWAIFENGSERLIGSTALVDIDEDQGTSLFRLVIGEKETWGQGYGTEATDLVLAEAFLRLSLRQVNLEVFAHNPRAQRAYGRVGFHRTGQHVEWVARANRQIDVIHMSIAKIEWLEGADGSVP
jgi:RimJ/RimL family protein N-acetyltransferase